MAKTLLEILNKLTVSALQTNNLAAECWLNNRNIYKTLEVCVCEYYAERCAFLFLQLQLF
jgi:hypothetical protein